MKLQTLKGFRDFLPKEAKKRQYVINTAKTVFESYGFEPLETPALEYEEVLLGKYGDEGDKLMYRFKDQGGRNVALRYDQTVPTSRVVGQYKNELPMPFKRYQIQNVWRSENTQKGRFREFLQCDADIFGTTSPLADAEVIVVSIQVLKNLGFKKLKVCINDREIFGKIIEKGTVQEKDIITVLRTVDKIKKIGREGVINELKEKGFKENAKEILQNMETLQKNKKLLDVFKYLKVLGFDEKIITFDPLLARGLDYYTSIIFEMEIDGYTVGSVCGGGRYDNLIEQLSGNSIPATGFALGFDRIIDAMDQFNLFPEELNPVKVLVTIFSKDLTEQSIKVCSQLRGVPDGTPLRSNNINSELFPDENTALEKQLKYADKKGIPFVLIIGPEEAEKNLVKIKNMKTGEQKSISIENVILTLS